jgi:hypothetical protein
MKKVVKSKTTPSTKSNTQTPQKIRGICPIMKERCIGFDCKPFSENFEGKHVCKLDLVIGNIGFISRAFDIFLQQMESLNGLLQELVQQNAYVDYGDDEEFEEYDEEEEELLEGDEGDDLLDDILEDWEQPVHIDDYINDVANSEGRITPAIEAENVVDAGNKVDINRPSVNEDTLELEAIQDDKPIPKDDALDKKDKK